MREAAQAASTRAVRNQLLPRRVLPLRRLLALMSLPGHRQAQAARCLAVGNGVTLGPISARMTSAVARLTPGMATRRWMRLSYGTVSARIRSFKVSNRVLSSSMCSSTARHMKRWCSRTRPSNACSRAGILARSRPRANSANCAGSLSPRMSASSMARTETPWLSVATAASLMLASSMTFCNRLLAAARSSVRRLR